MMKSVQFSLEKALSRSLSEYCDSAYISIRDHWTFLKLFTARSARCSWHPSSSCLSLLDRGTDPNSGVSASAWPLLNAWNQEADSVKKKKFDMHLLILYNLSVNMMYAFRYRHSICPTCQGCRL